MTRDGNYLPPPRSAFPVNLPPKFISELRTLTDSYFNEVFKDACVVDKLVLKMRFECDTDSRYFAGNLREAQVPWEIRENQ